MVMSENRASDSVSTSPLAGEVGAQRAPGGGCLSPVRSEPIPPSLTLPRKGGGDRPRSRRWIRSSLIVGSLAFAAALAAFASWVIALGPAPHGENLSYSTLVVDR